MYISVIYKNVTNTVRGMAPIR